MIAVISNTGTLRFRVFEERFTGPVFLDFLKRLVKDTKGRKLHVIIDGHPRTPREDRPGLGRRDPRRH